MTTGNGGPGTPGAFDGVRVLDLSEEIAAPFAARLIGDFGAEVIKIEKPRVGDPARYREPLVDEAPEAERSLLFQYLNWNKRSVTLNLEAPSVHPLFKRLVESSEILIESFKPGTLARWGLSFDQLFEWNPNLVITSVTNFGQTGPYAQYEADDLIFYAISGIASFSGRDDREPLKHGLHQSYFCAGLNATYATLAAHAVASLHGGGEHVDLSIAECLSSELVTNQPSYAFRGVIQTRPLPVRDAFSGDPLPTKDGYLTMQIGMGSVFEEFATLLGIEEFREPGWRNSGARQRTNEIREKVEAVLAEKPAREWFDEGTKLRLQMGMVQSAKDFLEWCPQLEAREFFQEVDHPATGRFKFPAELIKLSETPARIRRRSPLLGEHTVEVL
jgi:crotonobetainyl-CoA:carnitine CoA-transferase CaiB-like acyl-CoA transferase